MYALWQLFSTLGIGEYISSIENHINLYVYILDKAQHPEYWRSD